MGEVDLELLGVEEVRQDFVLLLDGQDELAEALGALEADLDLVAVLPDVLDLVSSP